MEPEKTTTPKRSYISRMVATGLFVSEVVGLVLVILLIIFWLRRRPLTSFQQVAGYMIPLALIAIYWLAVRSVRYFNDPSRLAGRLPVSVRKIVAWYVIVMSYILGAVVLFVADHVVPEKVWKFLKGYRR